MNESSLPSDEASPLSQLFRVDQACRRFEAAWKAGERPAIPAFLSEAAASDHAALLPELIHLEIHYRRLAHEDPRPQEYLGLFPSLDEAWLEDVLSSRLAPGRGILALADEAAFAAASTTDHGRAAESSVDGERKEPGDKTAPPGGLMLVPGYEILGDPLGIGGMGVVYKAWQIKAKRYVALKTLRSGKQADPEEIARFRTEAEAVARLQHPNIVQIHEVGEHDGLHFFSMEYCVGGSLDKKPGGLPLPPREAGTLVETLARAMHAAHGKRVVHRDLKPANVLLAEDGAPKISDFGLAKKLEIEQGQTLPDVIMGTPSYMAPEQASGKSKKVGPAADVYALGAILYECLTGRPPFKGPNAFDTLALVLTEDPVPVRRLQPKTPRDLETICLSCLQKEPCKRYATAAELAEDLRRFETGEPITRRPVGAVERSAKWVRRNPVVAGLAFAVVVTLLLGTGVSTAFGVLANASARAANRKADDEKAARERADKEKHRADDNADLAIRKAQEEKTAHERADKEKHRADDNADQAVKARTETERQLDRAKSLLFTAQLRCVAPIYETNPVEALALLEDAYACPMDRRDVAWRFYERYCRRGMLLRHAVMVSCVALSGDGKTLVSGSADGTVKVWDVGTAQERAILKGHTVGVLSVALSGDGKTIFSGSGDKMVKVWDVGTGQERATLKGHTGPVTSVALSGDGKTLFSGSWDNTVKVWDVDTGQQADLGFRK